MNNTLLDRYLQVRRHTAALVAPLSEEDMVVQSMPDASPAKWHMAHTTWFFETFLLAAHVADYRAFDPAFGYLFNSYYEALGPRQPRPQRGLLTRPPLASVWAYRAHVDQHMSRLLQETPLNAELRARVELGLAHEQQHQELLLMDLLHLFSLSPLKPAYNEDWPAESAGRRGCFIPMQGGLIELGHAGDGFAFDNEGPRHNSYLQPFEISDRLVTNNEWLAFIEADGYRRAELWLADGWALSQAEQWQAPLYWQQRDGHWQVMTLRGLQPIELDAPVSHISYYEAAAFATWADARLPTEAEWEHAAGSGLLEQLDDVAWQWTQSAYSAYPGFRPAGNAIGEYNGKFMVSQLVLRGGASVTPAGHSRPSYRNFFYPAQRWMFSGLRLARDASTSRTDPAEGEFARDVIAGLSAAQKRLAPKYFYDAIGSELFEAICRTPEYYPTRAETELLKRIASQLGAEIPAGAALIEFGSGASEKTRLLLDAAPQLGAYLPIDISETALRKAAAQLRRDYPQLQIAPQVADFSQLAQLCLTTDAQARVGFFPGSTLGNFTHAESVQFLRSVRTFLGPQARFIVGVDMLKDIATLEAAYDDADGITARFNKNLLVRINRELQGDFDPEAFDHLAQWNPEENCMEMYLVSRHDQHVQAAGQRFTFTRGERLHTECSHKYSVDSIALLAAEAGWQLGHYWLSAEPQVGLFVLES
jgi:dimethylhistidine N-methyltransferase